MPKNKKKSANESEDIRLADILSNVEFICWSVLVIIVFLRWFNGSPVSTDQFIVQLVLVLVSLTGVIGFRLFHLTKK